MSRDDSRVSAESHGEKLESRAIARGVHSAPADLFPPIKAAGRTGEDDGRRGKGWAAGEARDREAGEGACRGELCH